MDPLGFSLENFDAIGRWRAISGNAPIDASGSLPDGTKFEGAAGLRKLLLDQRGQFIQVFSEKLLAWALGRSLDYNDFPAVRKITREAASRDYRWSALIAGVVKSDQFQMSISKGPVSQAASSLDPHSRRSANHSAATRSIN
jgi:hypothetical protein